MENAHLRAVILPAMGARIESLRHRRSGMELVVPASEGPRWGLLCDQLWQQSFEHSDWNRHAYSVTVLERGPERVRLLLTGRGRTWAGVTISKYVSLEAGRAAIDVDYTLSAAAPSNARAAGDFWVYNGLPAGGRVFMPSETGVLERPLSVEPENWVYGPTRGWMAAVIGDAGLAVTMDFSRLKALRTSQEQGTSLEWLLRKASLKPGSSMKTSASLAPFTGLKRVDGVCRQFALEMTPSEAANGSLPVRLTVAAFEACSPTLACSVRRLPDGAPVGATEASLTLKADAVAGLEAQVPIAGEGSYVVSCNAAVDGRTIL
jgi:hypothetical protein